jgi:adenosyl cobinamide kinase/adenosyl cobinamide phosphate guanylyltransferase
VEKYVATGQAADDKWHMRIALWIPKATDTHSGYVTLIAFLLQQWLKESASFLRYT